MASFGERLKHSFNVFRGTEVVAKNYGPSFYSRPDMRKFTKGNKQSITSSAYNKIAVDCAQLKVVHCRVDADDRYLDTINDGLNQIFNVEANLDQTGTSFMQDVVMSMIDEGTVAVVPTVASNNISSNNTFDILQMRTGKITQWYPEHVRVNLYDDLHGRHVEKVFPKRSIAIIENPLYSVMNEPNSTLTRLIHKMNLLDYIDEQIGNGKIDMLVQLPYSLHSKQRKDDAKRRMKELEEQLADNKYGIGYIDSTEKIIQLNRPVDNNLAKQVEDLRKEFYNQLGLTENVFNGTASEAEMLNYFSRTIEPIMSAILNEFKRKFLTKTARTQGQSIKCFREPFKLTPVEKLADIGDTLSRNAILSANEFRGILGYRPVADPQANELSNKNINRDPDAPLPPTTNPEEQSVMNGLEGNYPSPSMEEILQMPMSQIRQMVRPTNPEGENQNG